MHRDFKLANVFIHQGQAIIGDFGFAKAGEGMTATRLGTPYNMAPELLLEKKKPYSSKADIWAIGIAFYQMLFGKRPFGEGMSQDKILSDQTMLRATRVEFPEKSTISQGAKDFITSCLTYDQDLRPDVITICNHSYLYPQNSKRKSGNSNTLIQMD